MSYPIKATLITDCEPVITRYVFSRCYTFFRINFIGVNHYLINFGEIPQTNQSCTKFGIRQNLIVRNLLFYYTLILKLILKLMRYKFCSLSFQILDTHTNTPFPKHVDLLLIQSDQRRERTCSISRKRRQLHFSYKTSETENHSIGPFVVLPLAHRKIKNGKQPANEKPCT